jgi:hypothetical protein
MERYRVTKIQEDGQTPVFVENGVAEADSCTDAVFQVSSTMLEVEERDELTVRKITDGVVIVSAPNGDMWVVVSNR